MKVSQSIQTALTKSTISWMAYKHFFLTVLKSRKSKIKVPAGLASGKNPLPGS